MPDALDTTDTVAAPALTADLPPLARDAHLTATPQDPLIVTAVAEPTVAVLDDWEVTPAGTVAHSSRRWKEAKNWEPLRALARKRARITLTPVWEDAAKGQRISRVDFLRFCYRDYPIKRKSLALIEQPYSLSLKLDALEDGKKKVLFHYCATVKGGRFALYARHGTGPKATVRHAWPFNIDITAPVDGAYPEVRARFSKRLVKMLRSKARAHGVKLAKGDDLQQVLAATLWPALEAVKAHHKALRGTDWQPGQTDRWLMRHMHCTAAELPKRVTGYGSKVVTRLFWEAMKPPEPRFNEQGSQFVVSVHEGNLWRAKWNWLALLRTWITVDHAQQILRSPKVAAWDEEWSKDQRPVRKLLKQWEPKRVLRMLTETCADSYTIRDTLRMLEQREARLKQRAERLANGEGGALEAPAPLPRTRDCNQLHEWLSAELRMTYEQEHRLAAECHRAAMTPEQRAAEEERERKARAPFEHSDELKAVAGRTVTTADGVVHTIILPAGPDDLQLWGKGMHNCIGSYAYRIRDGSCLILGVKTVGSERACDWGIEITGHHVYINGVKTFVGGVIVQFRGVCNEDAPVDLHNVVEVVLLEAKVLDPRNCALFRMNVQVEMDALRGVMAGEAAVLGENVAPLAVPEHNDATDALGMAAHVLRAAA